MSESEAISRPTQSTPRRKWGSWLAASYAVLFGSGIGQKLGQAIPADNAVSAGMQVFVSIAIMYVVWYFIGLGIRNTLYKFVKKRIVVGILGFIIGFILFTIAIGLVSSISDSDYAIERPKNIDRNNYSISGSLFRHNDYKFRIRFPEGWNTGPGDGPNVVIKSTDPTSGSSINIVVEPLPFSDLVSIYELADKDDLVSQLEQAHNTDIELLDYTQSTFTNRESIVIEYSLVYSHLGHDIPIRIRQIMFLHQNYLYSISCGYPPETYESIKPFTDLSLASFAFEDSFS